MEYRKLPKGNDNEKFSVLGLGMGGIQNTPQDEIERIIKKALDHGINFIDMCAGKTVYKPVGRAIKNVRDKVFLQVHFGAVYDDDGEYGWCRDFETIKKTFLWELNELQTDYVDFGFLHCVDELEDLEKLISIGLIDYLKNLFYNSKPIRGCGGIGRHARFRFLCQKHAGSTPVTRTNTN